MRQSKREIPLAGQESVWDYPRPPRLEATDKQLRIEFGGQMIGDTQRGYRVLETSHPPVYYFPPEDIRMEFLIPAKGASFCEWKGGANYYDLRVAESVVTQAAWTYLRPTLAFEPIRGFVAFYAHSMDRCTVNGELVLPQPGEFYGGWITTDIVGPFKGEPGSMGW